MTQKRESLNFAFFTSFLVMVLGAAMWGILYYYDIFSAWVAFLSAFGAGLAYTHFYKKQGFGFYAWIILLSIVLNLLSILFTLVIKIHLELGYTIENSFSALKTLIAQNSGVFVRDILLSIGFTMIGGLFLLLTNKFNPKKAKVEEYEQKPQEKVNVKVEQYQTAEAPLTKEEKQIKTVADYYVKEVTKIVVGKDPVVMQKQLKIFEEKYFSKMNQKMKAQVLQYLGKQKYEGNELKAVKVINAKLK